MLERICADVWIAEGPEVSFVGIPYPTRMGVVRLPSGKLWIWSPIALDEELATALAQLGEVAHLVEPNLLHHLALAAWQERWPEARAYAPPGLAKRYPSLRFHAELQDEPIPEFEGVIKQVVVRGSFFMEEVLFLHAPSGTLFVGDLVQKHDPKDFNTWQRLVMKADGMVGPKGSTPREWRATFLRREQARAAVRKAIAWGPERMVIAHGDWVHARGGEALRSSLRWLGV